MRTSIPFQYKFLKYKKYDKTGPYAYIYIFLSKWANTVGPCDFYRIHVLTLYAKYIIYKDDFLYLKTAKSWKKDVLTKKEVAANEWKDSNFHSSIFILFFISFLLFVFFKILLLVF